MRGGGGQTAVQRAEPWAGAQPYLADIFSRGQNLMNQGPTSYFPGQTYAGFSPQQLTAQGMALTQADQSAGRMGGYEDLIAALGQGDNPLLSATMGQAPQATDTLLQTMSRNSSPITYGGVSRETIEGMMSPQGNPYLDAMVSQAQGRTADVFTQDILPALQSQATAQGHYGFGAKPPTRETQLLTQTLGDMATNMYGGAYQADMSRALAAAQAGAGLDLSAQTSSEQLRQGATGQQLSAANQLLGAVGQGQALSSQDRAAALGFAPMLENLAYGPSQIYGQVGAQNQALDQQAINDAMARHYYPQQSEQDLLSYYANLIGGFNLPSTITSQQSYQQNPWLTAGGLGLAGYGLYNMMNPVSPWMTAAGMLGRAF